MGVNDDGELLQLHYRGYRASKRRKATYAYQVNATMAVKLCRDYLRAPDADGAKLMRQIARYSEPVRPGRQDERNLKGKSFVGFCYRVAA